MAVVIKCGSADKSRLGVEINDMGTKALLVFSAAQSSAPVIVKTDGIKVIKGLNLQLTFNPQGNQAVLEEGRMDKLFKNRSGLKFNCVTSPMIVSCQAIDKSMTISLQDRIMGINDNLGTRKQSMVKTDAVIIYKTSLGMEVTSAQKGKATYSGSKRKGAIVDSSKIELNCR